MRIPNLIGVVVLLVLAALGALFYLSPRDLALRGGHTQTAQTLDAALPGQKVR